MEKVNDVTGSESTSAYRRRRSVRDRPENRTRLDAAPW
jgi:hypothetical protein